MKYCGMPSGMWTLFHRSFRDKLVSVLGYDKSTAAEIEKRALKREPLINGDESEYAEIFRHKEVEKIS